MIAQDFRPAGRRETSPPAPASLTPALIGSAIVAALGGLLFGFDTVVISGTTEALRAVVPAGRHRPWDSPSPSP